MSPDLNFIRKYVFRNAYTGSAQVDLEALERDPALREMLRRVWTEGYNGGLDDAISECTVEQAHVNPYL